MMREISSNLDVTLTVYRLMPPHSACCAGMNRRGCCHAYGVVNLLILAVRCFFFAKRSVLLCLIRVPFFLTKLSLHPA